MRQQCWYSQCEANRDASLPEPSELRYLGGNDCELGWYYLCPECARQIDAEAEEAKREGRYREWAHGYNHETGDLLPEPILVVGEKDVSSVKGRYYTAVITRTECRTGLVPEGTDPFVHLIENEGGIPIDETTEHIDIRQAEADEVQEHHRITKKGYHVSVTAETVVWCQIKVEASSVEEAKELALEEAKHGEYPPDWEFSCEHHHYDHQVTEVRNSADQVLWEYTGEYTEEEEGE